MYTGYFAKLKTYLREGLVPVSIALVTPAWYDGKCFPLLAPTKSIFTEWKYGESAGDTDRYIHRYRAEVLEPMVRNRVVRMLEIVAEAPRDRIILLCYEKPSSFCHRHLAAEWLGDCKEFGRKPCRKGRGFCYTQKI